MKELMTIRYYPTPLTSKLKKKKILRELYNNLQATYIKGSNESILVHYTIKQEEEINEKHFCSSKQYIMTAMFQFFLSHIHQYWE